jgi:hypothetical protein
MKKFLYIFLLLVGMGGGASAQTINANKVITKNLTLSGKTIDSISTDIALFVTSNTHVPSVAAIKQYVANLLFQAKTTYIIYPDNTGGLRTIYGRNDTLFTQAFNFTGGTKGVKDSVNGIITVTLSTAGTTTLIAGTKAISIPGLTASSIAWFQVTNQNTAAATVQYSAVCTTNTLTIKALTSAGNNTINTADISTGVYLIKPN